MKKTVEAKILKNAEIAQDIFDLVLEDAHLAQNSKAGQFVMVYLDPPHLLPRPFGVCETNGNTIRLMYRVVGEGTKILSTYKIGQTLKVLGACGNGFAYQNEKDVSIIGGGMGAVPLLKLTREIKFANPSANVNVFLGFADGAQIILQDDFKTTGANVQISTDDGSVGFCGNSLEAFKSANVKTDVLYICGSKPMSKAVCAYANEQNIAAYASLEERMACGIGACVCCAVKVKSQTSDGGWVYEKVCKDGPVFSAKEVVWHD